MATIKTKCQVLIQTQDLVKTSIFISATLTWHLCKLGSVAFHVFHGMAIILTICRHENDPNTCTKLGHMMHGLIHTKKTKCQVMQNVMHQNLSK